MKTTFILSNLTDKFYSGFGESIVGLLNMSDAEKFAYLNKMRAGLPSAIKMKIGNGSFRDAVDLNSIVKRAHNVTFKLEPRKGYKLATFEHTAAL